MKTKRRTSHRIVAIFLFAAALANAADFNIASPGFFFTTNGTATQNPTITLVRGRLYTFAVSTASFHPFQILAAGNITNNNISSGTITYLVPTNAPATISPGYQCSQHHFTGTIATIDPPAPPVPPVPTIVSFSVGTNVVLRSAPATNTFSIVPEFKTNLNFTNWVPLTVISNRFLTGTNETICGRPSATNLFIRVRVQ